MFQALAIPFFVDNVLSYLKKKKKKGNYGSRQFFRMNVLKKKCNSFPKGRLTFHEDSGYVFCQHIFFFTMSSLKHINVIIYSFSCSLRGLPAKSSC